MSAHQSQFQSLSVRTLACCLIAGLTLGCQKTEPITTYRVSKTVPSQLLAEQDRMLAAMVPSGDQVWFFKVTGPESAVTSIEKPFRSFVENIKFDDGSPVISELPDGWKKGGDKPMRFASIDVDTPGKQLDISVSQLGRLDDYDAMVTMNVNRWRKQLSLDESTEKWAEGDEINVASADGKSVWVDITGKGGGGAPMTPPFAGGNAPFAAGSAPFAAGSAPFAGGETPPAMTAPQEPAADAAPIEPDERIQFDRPEGWRDGRMSSMRMAAFNVGPEDAAAEITVIPAGGDLRGNVARWLGQVRDGNAPDDVVDQILADATQVNIDGRPGQRYLLTSDDSAGQAIDATIVPLDGGMSLFIKMTGPAKTVTSESEAITAFLESMKLNL
ncbi:hypothetical protein [Rubripirellula reticaptiva]|uniref:Uncharacterized protein n=1 Tax=Rubripirellula reticaptiva TaxID=2528013 RepID=A0A5C6F7N3_9BACT|nr:hypothetical protein [Rubripirellula reticaptiva]TWU57255.1 hypothetical protein Poly59_01620 [Rubripirellula reticaptiva]